MMWLRDERPEIYAAAEKLIGVQDYVVYLLTGATSPTGLRRAARC